MTQPFSPAAERPRWRSALATLALVGALFAAGSVAPANAEVVGTGPGTISGTLTDDAGQPLAGESVYLSFVNVSAVTDATGHYELSGLELGDFNVSAYKDGYQYTSFQGTLTAGQPTALVNLVLVKFVVGVGAISGQVTADGVPLANQDVTAWNSTTGQNVFAVSDASGFYSFSELANGTWNIYSSAGSQYQYLDWLSATITSASPTATIDIAFLSWPVGTATISGLVTDSVTGQPIAGAQVSLNGQDVAHQDHVSSDANGAFSFELLPAGRYYMSFGAGGYLATAREIQLADGQALTVDAALLAANSTISGHLAGTDGSPAAGVYVNAYGDSGTGASAQADANGDYVLTGLGALQYTVQVGGPGTAFDRQEKVAHAIADGDVTVNFTLTPRTTGSIGGSVLGIDGDWVQTPVCATLYSAKSKKPLANVATWGHDFGDGSWFFDSVKPGTYTVEFRDCDDDPKTKFDKVFLGGVKNYKDATFITIAAAQDSYDNSVNLLPRK